MAHKFKTSMHRTRSPSMDFTYEKTDSKGEVTKHKHKTKTQQHLQKSTDVNYIVARCLKTGTPLPANPTPHYADYSSVPDYKEAQNILIIAKQKFSLLPAEIRSKFHNEPSEMLEFVHNPENKEECQELGLLPKPPGVYLDPKTITPKVEPKVDDPKSTEDPKETS